MVRVTRIEWNDSEYIAYGPGEIQPVYQVTDEPHQHLMTTMTWPTMAKWIPNARVRFRELSVSKLYDRYGPPVDLTGRGAEPDLVMGATTPEPDPRALPGGMYVGEEAERVALAYKEWRKAGYDDEVLYRAGVWARPEE